MLTLFRTLPTLWEDTGGHFGHCGLADVTMRFSCVSANSARVRSLAMTCSWSSRVLS